jgi:hypothetical protein
VGRKNKKGELTYWNFVAIDGVIGNQVGLIFYLTNYKDNDLVTWL